MANSTEFHIPDSDYLSAGGWMIENVWEALDTVNEWFFDPKESKLYMIPNITDTGAPSADFVAVQVRVVC